MEIGGSLTDYEMGCGAHKRFTLDVMPVTQPPSAIFWSASTAMELARGAAVAESVNLTAVDKEQFYLGTSPAVTELRKAEPTDDQLIMAMLKMIEACPERKQAFVENSRVPFKCGTTADPQKAARKIMVAERVRAALAGGKPLQTDETIVVGGNNAARFASALGMTKVPAPTLTELRTFLSSHFSSSVKRIFIWLDLPADSVVADVFVTAFAEELKAAAEWEHVVFVVLPPPYTELRLPMFDGYMEHFNKASPKLNNVLWLDDAALWHGYRFSRALGANELVVDGGCVYPEGTITSKGAAAAIKFLNGYCSWLIVETSPSTSDGREIAVAPRQDSADASLHVIRGKKIGKNSARGAPSRGGGGGFPQRGRGHYQGQARGNQSGYGQHRRGYN